MEMLCEFSLVAIKVSFSVSYHVVTLMSTAFVLHCLLKRVQNKYSQFSAETAVLTPHLGELEGENQTRHR